MYVCVYIQLNWPELVLLPDFYDIKKTFAGF